MTTEEARARFGEMYSFETPMRPQDTAILLGNDNNGIFSDELAASLKIGRLGLDLTLTATGGEADNPKYLLEYEIIRRDADGEWQNYRVMGRKADFDPEGIEQHLLDTLLNFAQAEGLSFAE